MISEKRNLPLIAEAVERPRPSTKGHTGSYRTGLILLLLSATIFFVPQLTVVKEDAFFGLFAINMMFTIGYLCVLLFTGALKAGRGGQRCLFIFLLLGLISAYALNRTIPVFEETVGWMGVLLVVVSGAYLALPYMARLLLPAQQLIAALMGIAMLLWVYLSAYLVPLYPLSLVVAIGFGISLHSFVSLFLLIFTLRWAVRAIGRDHRLAWGFSIGAGLSIVVAAAFAIQWEALQKVSARSYRHSLMADNTDLPSWIKVSRELPDSWVTERYLKGDLVYTTGQGFNGLSFWDMPSRGFDEVRKHDPLVMIASLYSGSSPLAREDRIKILESKYDARHKTEERLWSGAHLRTTAITTNANIWPDKRLAYTEQIFTVANKERSGSWRPQEEAIYTFHLPEGSAVTSLSLWIDGQESKAVLTTKGKADNAYRKIVGAERRDPSLVHWVEGNRVSVRVFPVVAGSHRVFKIGVTTPLVARNGRLVYRPMQFEGPQAERVQATTQLSIAGDLSDAKGLGDFRKDAQGRYLLEGSYDDSWQLSFKAPDLQPAAFSFNGFSYALEPYAPARVPAPTRRIYLDLNAAWSRSEFNAVYELARGRELYACTDEIVRIDDNNKNAVFEAANKASFSLFPLFGITDPASALLVAKSEGRSPDIQDLRGSGFAAKLEEALRRDEKIRLFNLGDELSPYLKSLKEHRAFRYEHGSLGDLDALLSKGQFAAYPETANSIVIEDAGMRITKTAGTAAATGSDHLQRLFAYNHLIQQLGKNLYTNMEADPALVQEASEAYVVSPVSSLVVLESAADYARFGIRDNMTSLKNASVQSQGAVPEPREWALIIIGAGLLVWLRIRRFPMLKLSGK
jgi:XrtN system VIT domain protein